MCGIAGYIGTGVEEPGPIVARVTASQRARGPDHEAVVTASDGATTVVLGHNRLSIIDLSEVANQPMWDRDRRCCIVYNGEIYNYIELRAELASLGHRFVTQSDTEVILEAFKAWGADCLHRFNGMFAFALWNVDDQTLWLARDRFGVKPLYYGWLGRHLLFASTPGPLAQELDAKPDLEYVARGLHHWIYEDDSALSPYVGVYAVPPGSMALANVAGGNEPVRVKVSRWYDYIARVEELREASAQRPHAALLEEFTHLLTDATRLRLRSDVPVALSLSGGLDSTSIATIVARLGVQLIGFTFGDPADATSEARLAQRTAKRLGMDVVYVSPQEMNASALEASLSAQDAPFPDLSVTAQYLVMRAAHERGIKVVLGGQGSDEMLMGYRKFQLMLLQDALRERHLRRILSHGRGLSLMALSETRRAATYVRQVRRYTRSDGLKTSLNLPRTQLALGSAGRSAWQRQLVDATRLSLPTLLRYEDRNSSSNSLETRLPFLDFRLAEFSGALPDRLKVHDGYGKWILRRAMQGLVDDEIRLARYKRGFDVARSERGRLGAAIRQRLAERQATVATWMRSGDLMANRFGDQRLVASPVALAEATSLLWLAERTRHGLQVARWTG